MFGLSNLATRIALAAIAIVLVLGFLWLNSCDQRRNERAQAKVDTGQTKASDASQVEAMNTFSNSVEREADEAAIVQEGKNEIAKAPDGHSADAARRANCRLRVYRNSRQCAELLGQRPAPVEGGR